MIVGERKPFDEILGMLEGYKNILVVGCGTCVAVCMSGGEKEVEILAGQLRMSSTLKEKGGKIDEVTLTRQCDKEYLDQIEKFVDDYDVILSTACGAGVQFLAEKYAPKLVFPALNTRFIGVAEGAGHWTERCGACSDCLLAFTGGICPVTICAKGLLNGPCGGNNHGKCEVDSEKDCAWTLIYDRLKEQGRLDLFTAITPPKNYQVQLKPGRYTHPAYQEQAEEKE